MGENTEKHENKEPLEGIEYCKEILEGEGSLVDGERSKDPR